MNLTSASSAPGVQAILWISASGMRKAPLIASATATLLFRQVFVAVPDELVEAARMDGAGPLVIVQKKAAGNDQEDRVLRILERFGIRVSPQRTQQVRHIRCHQPAEDDEATRHLFERLGSDTSSVGLSFDWSTLDEKPNV